jgi:hypothetical protein
VAMACPGRTDLSLSSAPVLRQCGMALAAWWWCRAPSTWFSGDGWLGTVFSKGAGGSVLGLSVCHVAVAGGLSVVVLVEVGLVVRFSPSSSMV